MATPDHAPSPAVTASGAAALPAPIGRFATWRYVFNTANLPVGMTTTPDAISKVARHHPGRRLLDDRRPRGSIGGLLAVGAARLTRRGHGATGGSAARSSRSSAWSSPTPRTT